MKFRYLILLFLASTAHAVGPKEFFKTLPKSEYVFLAFNTADMFTTLDIKNHPGMYETNAILGKNPSDSKIYTYFMIDNAIHMTITYQMVKHNVNPKYIKAWEYFSIGYEAGYVIHNYHIGLRVKF